MIAAVAVDVPLPHLDRTFDYRVPDELRDAAAVGVRVRVRFAGRLVSGIVMALHDDATHATAELRAVVSPAVVLTPPMARLVRAVADHYAGTFDDVVRFAVPPRHARAEAIALAADPPGPPRGTALEGPVAQARGMRAFVERSTRGEAPRACLELPTLLDLHDEVAAISAALVSHQSVVVVVADASGVAAVDSALQRRGIHAIVMRPGDGPSVRQRTFTSISRASRCVVVGTRSAVFAPVADAGTTIVVDDGSDALVEEQSPGWHAREVALLRSDVQRWSSLFVGHHRSVELQAHVVSGRVKALAWSRDQWRRTAVPCEGVPERYDDADPLLHRLRIPPSAFRGMREGLRSGPVLVSVAHRGYATAVRCGSCRETARCRECRGPIGVAAEGAQPRCRWCGTANWTCEWCGGTRVHFTSVGVERTREELGRAFPGVPIRVVDADHPLATMPSEPHLLLVTPGAEPAGRAALAVILDVETVLARHDLSAAPEAVRRWFAVASHVRAGGRVLLVGSASAPAVQALVRNDPVGFAEREFAERASAALPPAVHGAVIEAPAGSTAAQEVAAAVAGLRMLGPVEVAGGTRWVALHADAEVVRAGVRAMIMKRSAAKTLAGIRVRLDPLEIAT